MSCMGPRTRLPDHLCPAVRSGCYALHNPSALRNVTNFTAICLGTLDLNQNWPGARLDVTSEADGHFTRICIALAHVLGSDATSVMETVRRQRQRSPALRKTTVLGMLYRLGSLVSKLVSDELTHTPRQQPLLEKREKNSCSGPFSRGISRRQNAPIAAPCRFITSVVERRS